MVMHVLFVAHGNRLNSVMRLHRVKPLWELRVRRLVTYLVDWKTTAVPVFGLQRSGW